MSSVDVSVQSRKAIGKTLGNETLGGEVIALIEIVLANDMKNARITFKARGMKCYLIQNARDAAYTPLRCFQSDSSDEAVNLITQAEQMLGKVASILTGYSGNECLPLHMKLRDLLSVA